MLNRPYNFFFLLLFNQPILYSKFSSLHRMERIACTYEDIRLDQLEAGIEREGNYTVRRSNLSQSMMPLQTNSWRIPRESSSSSLFVPSISFPPASPLSTPFFATRYPLLCIISFLYSAIGLHSRTQSFIIFRWKKGGQKYTEYPRARRHPVDYFENIIAKRGEEKRGRRNGEEMEKGQASVEKARFSTSS